MFVHLNPQYTLRFEKDCSFLIRRNGIIDPSIDRVSQLQSVLQLPTAIGYILDKIGEFEFEKSISYLSNQLRVSYNVLSSFLNKIVENDNPLIFKIEKFDITLPSKLLVKTKQPTISNISNYYNICNCNYTEYRPSIPFSVNFMVTTKCVTNCCYCYAKRNISKELSTKEILSIIDECHEIGVVNLNLTGGDIFTRNDWKILLRRVRKYNYFPFLSTKKPLSIEDIEFLKSIGITDLQFSLDSVDSNILQLTVAAESTYISKVRNMFEACKKYKLKLAIRSVLCCYNTSVKHITELYNFLNSYRDIIIDWVITPAFFSEHQKDYLKYAAQKADISAVGEFITNLVKPFPILLSKMNSKGYTLQKCRTVEEYVSKNQKCYANSYSMSILASGSCTVCEMLYEKTEYNLGSVLSHSIKDIWNGNKALTLYHLSQESFSNRTPCAICHVFDKCRNKLAKRVCYVDIAKMNDFNNSREMPDPRCPKAVKVDVIL